MDRELRKRIDEAGRYQKLASLALLPRSMAGHMDVIEKEIRAMVMEGAADFGRMGLNWYLERAGESERMDPDRYPGRGRDAGREGHCPAGGTGKERLRSDGTGRRIKNITIS